MPPESKKRVKLKYRTRKLVERAWGGGAIFPTKTNVIKADLSIHKDPEKILISKRDAHCTTYDQFSPDFCKISRRSDSKGRRLLDTARREGGGPEACLSGNGMEDNIGRTLTRETSVPNP